MNARIARLVARLEKGIDRTQEVFGALNPDQLESVCYAEPYPWTVRDLLAHFLSAEEGLVRVAQDVVAGGRGAPEGFDYDTFNASERDRLADRPPQQLLSELATARQQTIAWARELTEEDLDRTGRHPALGEIDVETFLNVIYGHQLLHVREMLKVLDL